MQDVRGQLAPGILPDVLRHVGFLRESGRLVVLSDPHQGLVVIRGGRLVHAATRHDDGSPVHGLEALNTILTWTEGTYRLDRLDGMPAQGPEAGSTADRANDTLAGDLEDLLEAALAGHAANGRGNGVHAKGKPTALGTASAASTRAYQPAEGSDTEGSETLDADIQDVFLPEPAATVGTTRPPNGPEIGPQTVLERLDLPATDGRVVLSRGALALWLRIDGETRLDTWSAVLGAELGRVVAWSEKLLSEQVAAITPEPLLDPSFVPRLTAELIEIMGPMGEILVDEALSDLGLDPAVVPEDRLPALIDTLAAQLHRSDWQMKLRARATRLRAEMGPRPATKEPR